MSSRPGPTRARALRPHRVGKVPRRNEGANANALLDCDHPGAHGARQMGIGRRRADMRVAPAARVVDRQCDAVGPRRLLREPVEEGGAVLDLATGLRQRFAALQGQQPRKILLALAQAGRDGPEIRGPLLPRRATPCECKPRIWPGRRAPGLTLTVVARNESWARPAAATAASASSRPISGTEPSTSSVEGLTTSMVAPERAGTQLPSTCARSGSACSRG